MSITASRVRLEAAVASGQLLYLSRDDVRRLLPGPSVLSECVRGVFTAIGRGNVSVSPKSELLLENGATARAMKAALPGDGVIGMKWVTGHPGNTALGLPTIHATLILNDATTGAPIAIMDASWITAMRTAACSALAARYLARADSASLGIIACGLQGRANIEAIADVFPLTTLHLFDTNTEYAEALAREVRETRGLSVQVADSPLQVAKRSDILVTSAPIAKRPRRTLGARALRAGSFACLLDFDATMTSGAMARADRFVVDDRHQLRAMQKEGYCRTVPEPQSELCSIVAGRTPGRQHDSDATVAMNMGIAPLDVAVARLLVQRARDRQIGTTVAL